MKQIHHTFCRICEALCGLRVETDPDAGRVLSIRGDDQHCATQGACCPKGLHQHELYGSPDRLRLPQKRVGDRFVELPWSQALAELGERVQGLRALHGPDAIAMYIGTAAGFSVLHPIFAQGFMTGLGSRSMYSSSTQDCSSKFAVSRLMYGYPFTLPHPDLERTRCLIMVGANPLISRWTFLQVPHPARELKAIVERGGALWIVDARRTETSRVAGETVLIRPGTDVFFYLGFLHEVLRLATLDRARLAARTLGLERLEALAAAWPLERCAAVTGIPPATMTAMVRSYLEADGAALYCGTGVTMGAHGSLCVWLQEAVNAITGNLDRAGGTLVGRGLIDFPAFGKRSGTLLRDDRSRVGGLPSVNDAFAGGLLAEEILTPGQGQVRALFVSGGNPLLTMPASAHLREALAKLELLVCLDIFRNETGQLAHYVLPTTSPLERPDLPFIFPLMLGLQLRPYLQATDAVLPPPGEARDEASIYLDLCEASRAPLFGSRVAQAALRALTLLGPRRGAGVRDLPQRLLLDGLLRLTRQGSFRRLLGEPHGRPRPPHRPGSFLPARLLTASGKLELAPPELLERARCLDGLHAQEFAGQGRFKLISKRSVTTHNSWTHNLERFVRGGQAGNRLHMSPIDAERLGLAEGDCVDVRTAAATVRVPIKITRDLPPLTVALPHGFGHQQASGLAVASQAPGVNANLLPLDGPAALDPLSGQAQLTGIPVDVEPARGPYDPRSWSGIGAAAD